MKKNKLIAIATIATISSLSIATIASPILENIKAQYHHGITYELDGNPVMDGQGGIMYKGKVYVPLRSVSETLGVEINYENGKVYMLSVPKNFENKLPVADNTGDTITDSKLLFTEGQIINISEDFEQITLKTNDGSELILNTNNKGADKKTEVKHEVNKRMYQLEDLEIGMSILAEHSAAMTKSLPAQTETYKITILPQNDVVAPEQTVTTKGEILQVDTENLSILVKDENNQEILFNLNENSTVKHEKNKRAYTIKDLEKGMTVSIDHSLAMTLSLPPQSSAFAITILK